MKKAFCLIYFVLIFGVMSQAQQKKSQIPKVNLEKFTPPANNFNSNKQSKKDKMKNIPKVDLSNFKPPANKSSKEENN